MDDYQGYDISDDDNDVRIQEGRDKEFYHGTHISSLIAQVATMTYGSSASDRVKIMPVKVLSDYSATTYLKDGYKGIRYAIDSGVDIICLAWSGGEPSRDELAIIKEAEDKGILIIASAGNFNTDGILNPAVLPSVMAVGGHNRKHDKYFMANFGGDVDISAPAEYVYGAHPEKDNAFFHIDGTSPAAGLVAGCAAVLKSINPELTSDEIKEALMNGSRPFEVSFTKYGGKMGAGMLNLKGAVDYITNPHKDHFSSLRSKGAITINPSNESKEYLINPPGGYHGFYFEPDVSKIKKTKDQVIDIIVQDTLWNSYTLSNLPRKYYVPATNIRIDIAALKLKKNESFKLSYFGSPIDSTSLYCSEIIRLDDLKGRINDGSAEMEYANHSSCKWLIKVPEGKRIKIDFMHLDTQINVDFVHFYDGETTIPENAFARYSGNSKTPPPAISRTNEVLVWFLTDGTGTGQGWEFTYEIIE